MRVRLQQRKSGFFYKSAYQVEIAGTSFMSDKVENTNKIELRLQRGVSGGDFDIGTIFPVIFFVMLVMFFSFMVPHTFMTIDNLTSILNDGAVLAIIACGLTVVLVAGEFDLSIASAASFGGALAAVLAVHTSASLALILAIVVLSGALIGAVNGILVSRFEIPALIATIAVASLLDGATTWITGNEVIFSGFSASFLKFGSWQVGDLQASVFYLIVGAVTLGITLHYTAIGRRMYAIGGNRAASRMAGIRVQRQVIIAFCMADVFGALAGFIYTSRQGSLTPLFGTPFLLPTFAAAFLGSVSLARRKFHVLGTVFGVYLIETGTVGLLVLGAPAYSQQLFAGAVLILATIGARHWR
jgi:ribose transport system permease protein